MDHLHWEPAARRRHDHPDASTFIRDNRGQNMELNPRPVDVEVERPAGERYLGIDSQLDAAVRTLLAQIGRM